MAKDRERRYQSMREVASDLQIMQRAFASGAAAVFPIGDRPTEIIRIAPATENAKPTIFLRSKRGWVLAAAAALAGVIFLYAVFFRGPGSTPISSGTSVNTAAYDSYLRGKVNVGSENRENNEAAIKLLKEAIAADPNFAEAYAELARACIIKSFQFASDAEKKKLHEDAAVAVEKALTLKPNLPEGHFARGQLLWTPAKGFPHELAIQSYKRALALNPKLDEAHHQLGMIYSHIGLLEKSWDEIQRAVDINPANTLARFRLGVVNLYQGKYEEAVTIFKTIPHDANPALLDRTMATAYFQLGRTQEASDIVDKYLRAYPTDEGGNVTSVKAMLQARAGQEREAEATIQRAVGIGKGFGHFHHTAYNIALAYALLNKPEDTVKWLQTAADDGLPCYPLFDNDPSLNNVRKDEHFIAFMAKLKPQWERYKATF